MNKMNFARLAVTPVVAAGLALLQFASAGSALAAANCIKGEHKAPFKIGWANIYSIPTWMKETTGTIEDMANGGGHVATILIGSPVRRGDQSTTIYQHQSTLRLTMELLGITDFPGAAATAPDMNEFF